MMKTYTISFLLSCFLFAPFFAFSQGDAASRFYQNGETLRKGKQYKKAIEEYDHALVINNNLPQALYGKGMCFYFLKDTTQASENIEKAITLKPTFLKGYSSLIKIYTESENINQLVATYDKMVKVSPKKGQKVSYKIKAAKVLLRDKEYKKALEHTKAAVVIAPSNYDALYYNAKINNLLGNYDASVKNMNTVIKSLTTSDPKRVAKLYYELGYAQHKLGKHGVANKSFEKANVGPYRHLISKLQPGYFYKVANSLMQINELKEAKEVLNIALKIEPTYPNANKLLGEISIKLENHQKALHHYKKAIKGEKSPQKKFQLYSQIIEIEINIAKYTDATKTIDEAIKEFPNKNGFLFSKAITLYKSGKKENAVDVMTKLLAAEKLSQLENVKFNFAMGMMQFNQEKLEDAARFFKTSKKGPFSSASQYKLDIISEKSHN